MSSTRSAFQRRSRGRRSQRNTPPRSSARSSIRSTLLRESTTLGEAVTTSALSSAYTTSVISCTDWSSFAAVYDEFRVNSITIQVNATLALPYLVNGTNGGFGTAVDPTDAKAQTFAEIADYQSFISHQLTSVRPYVTRRWVAPAPHDTTTNEVLPAWQPTDRAGSVAWSTFLVSTPDVASLLQLTYPLWLLTMYLSVLVVRYLYIFISISDCQAQSET